MSDRPMVYAVGKFVKTTIPDGIKAVYCNTNDTAKAFMFGGADYKVPTGKKFTVYEVQGGAGYDGKAFTIYSETSPTATSNPVFEGIATTSGYSMPCVLTFSAGRYPVLKAAGSVPVSVLLYGIEEAA